MKIYIAIFILLKGSSTFAQFCTLDNRFTETEYFDALEIDSVIDIQYGSAINDTGTLKSVLLDAFFPNNAIDPLDSRPAVVMIHGRGFSGGQKEDRWGECIELAKEDMLPFLLITEWDGINQTLIINYLQFIVHIKMQMQQLDILLIIAQLLKLIQIGFLLVVAVLELLLLTT